MDGSAEKPARRRVGRPRKALAPRARTPAEAIDAAWLASTPATRRKALGQVLTPPDLARLMADWIAPAAPVRVLDPALGTGVLARAVAARLPDVQITGYEIDPTIADAGRTACALDGVALDLRVADFLDAVPESFDAVIANPPWLRPRAGNGLRARIQAMARETGLPLMGPVNAYALFVIAACGRLRPGGRAAFLLPAEWVNANSGSVLKDFLLNGWLRRLVYLCNLRPVFAGALTTASLVLVEAPKGPPPKTVEVVFIPEGSDLPPMEAPARSLPVATLRAAPKWDALIRDEAEALPPGFVRLAALATTRRGVATGANAFFHLTRAEAARLDLAPDRLRPCVAKAGDAPGPVFDAPDLARLDRARRPTVFVDLTPPLGPAEAAYVAQGVAQGLDQRFLTRARTPWHAPEKLYVAPVWATTFIRDEMRFVWNAAGALQLTAFHGIFPRIAGDTFARALTACLNAAPVQRHLGAQMRRYGGGLRKIEPRDLMQIAVPDLSRVGAEGLAALGSALDALNAGRSGAKDHLDRLVEEIAAQLAKDEETGGTL